MIIVVQEWHLDSAASRWHMRAVRSVRARAGYCSLWRLEFHNPAVHVLCTADAVINTVHVHVLCICICVICVYLYLKQKHANGNGNGNG